MSMFRHALLNRSALQHTLQIPKQSYSPSPQPQDDDSDYEMTASPVSSPNITTRSLSPSDMILVSPSPSPSPSPSIHTRKLRVTLPVITSSSCHEHENDHDDDDNTLSPIPDESMLRCHTNDKEINTIPLQYPGLGTRYSVISTIQESLFGSVHLAEDTICKRQVAIKISRRILSTSGTARSGNPVLENVLNEARIMRDLQITTTSNHHIVPLLDEIEDIQNHYLITPYYNQGDLYTYLTTLPHTRMNEIQAKLTFKQLIHAVSYMHQHGIAHRDLSLENIMLHQGKNGLEAYIIDLGVAAINPSGPGATTFPCPGAKLASEKPGKAMYISPELWSGHEWEAYSNDIFSLGVILYCMLVGRQPFNSSIDVWAQFITSGKWYKLLQHVADGKIKPESIDPNNYNYWVAAYQHLSPQVLDLISHLLCPIQKRYTLQQIMNHPWMKQL